MNGEEKVCVVGRMRRGTDRLPLDTLHFPNSQQREEPLFHRPSLGWAVNSYSLFKASGSLPRQQAATSPTSGT